jgi:hypothetical protein
MRKLFPLFALVFMVGCGQVNPSKNPDPVDITGSVTMGGKPVDGVVLNLQPTKGGAMATMTIQQGKVKGAVMPGKYTYFISESKNPAIFAKIPKQYYTGADDRQIDVSAGTTLTIALD